jgi:hypothetical protein
MLGESQHGVRIRDQYRGVKDKDTSRLSAYVRLFHLICHFDSQLGVFTRMRCGWMLGRAWGDGGYRRSGG